MAHSVLFVDSIASSPTTRLNLNDLTAFTTQRSGINLSPPELKRVRTSTYLRDGSNIPATAYDDRVLTIEVLVEAANRDTLGTQLQTLGRELDRKNNILKYQEDSATNPVFFRTYRSPNYKILERSPGTSTPVWVKLRLEILCEPFAYGLEETNTATTNRNPASGLHFEIAAADAKGDVATPLYLKAGGTTTLNQSVLCVRRHGTPATYYVQCESMSGVLGASSADANSSGGNVWLVNADPGGVVELSWSNFPSPTQSASSDDDYRGVYRVFLRCKVSAGTFTVAMDTPYASALTAVSVTSTNFRLHDLGLITIPPGSDPIYDGYTNTALSVRTITSLDFIVDRTAGSGSFSMDYAVALPADEEMCFVDFLSSSTLRPIWDGPNDMCWMEHTSGGVGTTSALPARSGSIPNVQPNQVNRFYLLENIASQNAITGSESLTWSYWPRWLHPLRPA